MARFVRPILLYGQNGPDRKNMAIMQFRDWAAGKIAKMQDGTRSQIFRSDVITASTWRKNFPPRQRQIGGDVGRKCTSRQTTSSVKLSPEDAWLTSPPSHSTVIHHKRASRYVVLGEISHSPFTEYIFVEAGTRGQISFPAVHVLRDGSSGLVRQLGYPLQFCCHILPPQIF